MQIITDKFITSICLHHGAESLKSDIELIEQFINHAAGCGLESLDGPSGKLIETGMAARYPNHFEIGSGLEGLSGLVAKLKQGLSGLKKMARGKAKPFIEKQISTVSSDIKKTYGNKSWLEERGSTGKDVKVESLSKLIGNFKDFAGLVAAVESVKKTLGDAFDDHLKRTADYVNKVNAEVNKVSKLRGKSDEELVAYGNEQLAIFKPLREALKEKMPAIEGGSTSTIGTITVEQAKQLGDLMLELLAFGGDLEEKAEDLRMDGAGQDVFDDLDLEDGTQVAKLLSELHWNYWYWEMSTYYNSEMADDISAYAFSIVQKLEAVIISALK